MSRYSPLQLAESYLKTGEWAYVLEALADHLAQQPDDQVARLLRVQVLIRLNELSAAQAEAALLADDDPSAWHWRGILHSRAGQPAEAVFCAEQACALAPGDERLAERLLDLYSAAERWQEARRLILAQPPRWGWLARLAEVENALGNYEAARTAYERALEALGQASTSPFSYLRPIRGTLLAALARTYAALGADDQAQAAHQQARRLLPRDPSLDDLLTFSP
ncbi:MAG: tetratricopeptide repeat protein [Anaerolineae bacterium]|nr:tetratricopeptide repeat protein [Anaerolineae bacterium]MDW8171674.1 tetratricopeptide repeat protein [Anaerolineae bacterium]